MKLYATGGNGPRKDGDNDDDTPVDTNGRFAPKKPDTDDAGDVAEPK